MHRGVRVRVRILFRQKQYMCRYVGTRYLPVGTWYLVLGTYLVPGKMFHIYIYIYFEVCSVVKGKNQKRAVGSTVRD